MATTQTATDAPTPVHYPEGEAPTTQDPATHSIRTESLSRVSSTQASTLRPQAAVPTTQPSLPSQVRHDTDRLPDSYFHDSLFRSDNTGTRKFKGLLQGLKIIINREYDPSDNPDLMPDQLARFYRDLHGDYDQLYLNTPSQSIAFIYKSLGCSYSLQPQPRADRVEEPDVPALKTEGWIMWSTIQLLLGPDEHAGFLMDAVKRWDVVDPETGKIFPKTLPRECFPTSADKHMAEWYEGVSDRLRQEAEEEAEMKERQEAIDQHAQHRRIAFRRDEDQDSIDSRGPALAYFRNPLYRHVDGRPSIVRRRSRPPVSPRPSIVERGKVAATTVGQVIRNVASPRLWDGPDSSGSRRRRSVPDNRYHHPSEPALPGVAHDDRLPPPQTGSPRLRRTRRRSDRADSSNSDHSSTGDIRSPQEQHLRPMGQLQREQSLRHSRSHEPTPSQREYDDYFQQGDIPYRDRRGSAQNEVDAQRPPSFGPSFAPSPGLPMAAQIARQQSERRPPPRHQPYQGERPYSRDRRKRSEEYDAPPRKRSRSRYDDRPLPAERPDDRSDDRSRHHHRHHPRDQRPFDDSPRKLQDNRARFDDRRPHSNRPRDRNDYESIRRDYDSPDRRKQSEVRRRSASARRNGGSDLDSGYDGPDDENRRDRKQTRFAPGPISGVDGRQYVDDSPWHSR